MNWDAVAAITEAVGVLVVIASLFYIAIQIKQNSALLKQNGELARAAMIHDTSVFVAQVDQLLAQNEGLASVFQRGKSGEVLNEVDQTRYLALIQMYLSWLEDINNQYQAGLFFDDADDPDPVEDMLPYYGDMLRPGFVQRWWEGGARYHFYKDFRHKMEKILINLWSRSDE